MSLRSGILYFAERLKPSGELLMRCSTEQPVAASKFSMLSAAGCSVGAESNLQGLGSYIWRLKTSAVGWSMTSAS